MPKVAPGKHPNSRKNLEKGNKFTKENAAEKARKGAEAAKKTRARNKTFQELAKALLNESLTEKEKSVMKEKGFTEKDFEGSRKGAILLSAMKKAIDNGDTNAMSKIAEVAGEHTPQNKQIVEGGSEERPVLVVKAETKGKK